MELRVVKKHHDLTHVVLTGRLDAPGVQEIEPTFIEHIEAQAEPALVDLSEVTFMGSTGIRMFLKVAKGLSRHGVKMVLLKPQPLVEDSLMWVSFNNLVPIEHDITKALEILKGGAT
jgi:anti-anti-sigma factor